MGISRWVSLNCSGGLSFEAARYRACASRTAGDVAIVALSAVIGAVNKLESSVIPLLAVMQGGESPYSNFFTAP